MVSYSTQILPTSGRVGVVGAGILGRLMAMQLYREGLHVTLIDEGGDEGQQSCSYAAGGMLSPMSELETGHLLISRMGVESLELWPQILQQLPRPVFFQQKGSLVVAHPQDQKDLFHFQRRIEDQWMHGLSAGELPAPFSSIHPLQVLSRELLHELLPSLDRRFHTGLYLPHEGQLSPRETLQALAQLFHQWEAGIQGPGGGPSPARFHLRFGQRVKAIRPQVITTTQGEEIFDLVVDCRGLRAREDLGQLRGVRGELIWVKAPEVQLERPLRLMHPRYPLYVIPRPQSVFLLGATSIESEHRDPISVRSTLELLSAAYSLHPAFAEAHILESVVQWRPALPHHLPGLYFQPGLLRINGLYRHGFLISPRLSTLAMEFLRQGSLHSIPSFYHTLFHAEGDLVQGPGSSKEDGFSFNQQQRTLHADTP